LRYGHRHLTQSPCLVAVQVADVLRLRGWRGAARRCSPGCPIS
jgi:hypothetical protein